MAEQPPHVQFEDVPLDETRGMARELNVPVTVRRVPGGVIFWRSSAEDLQQSQGTASRLQTAQRQGRARRGRRKRPL
jgi:hypothetical protein